MRISLVSPRPFGAGASPQAKPGNRRLTPELHPPVASLNV